MNIPVIYEDDWMVILDKPSGLLTVPTPKKEPRTLTSILNEDLRKRGVKYNLYPCHRLDRETSGLIIYAKGKSARDKITGLFRRKQVKKTYVAFVQGFLSGKGEIRNPVEGLNALTEYRVIRQVRDFTPAPTAKERQSNTQLVRGFTIVEAMPFTGRTNQIRIHFKQIGHPVVGETKFAFRKDFLLKAKRICLYAKSLEFMHPVTGKRIHLSIGLPSELKNFLELQGESF